MSKERRQSRQPVAQSKGQESSPRQAKAGGLKLKAHTIPTPLNKRPGVVPKWVKVAADAAAAAPARGPKSSFAKNDPRPATKKQSRRIRDESDLTAAGTPKPRNTPTKTFEAQAPSEGRRSGPGAEKRKFTRSSAPAIPRAKRLQVRDMNQDFQKKAAFLRQKRDDLDTIEPIRLQKALAASGAGSRRDMEESIAAGQVLVNGKVASVGDRVGPQDKVVFKGHPIRLKWPDRLPRIIAYHKQEGEIVSRDDPSGRVTIFDRLPQAKSSRWVAIGRLDVNTSGLLLVTTSGELANRMMHPSFEMEREYSVRVLGDITPEMLKEMSQGVELEDGTARFERIFSRGGTEDGANKWYGVVIKEGRNREVRRIFESFGLTVSRLIRVRFANIHLPPRLKRGQFYELNELEVVNVMKFVGLTQSGRDKR